MSQSIAKTSFLEDCISKKRTFQTIHESLNLYSESADARKEPVFVKEEANDLHKRVKEVANSFKASYRNEREKLLADLVKDDAFSKEIEELGASYGQKLWGRTESCPTRYSEHQASSPDDLYWDDEKDRETIQFYIRCWITRYAVQTMIPRKGKARTNVVSHGLSENEHSDTEHPRTPPQPNGTVPSDLPIRVPEVPGMLPPAETLTGEPSGVRSRIVDEGSLDVAIEPATRSPTTPNKRKALSNERQPTSGKLQKVIREPPATTASPRERQRDIYSGLRSPTSISPMRLAGLGHRDQRENTCSTDKTWAPLREGTFEIETAIDPDEVMKDTQELLSDVQITSDGDTFGAVRSPTAGPSGTYRNPQRQGSVILSNTQNDADALETDPSLHHPSRALGLTTEVWRSASISTAHVDVSRLNDWQEKQLRIELFKLLLSFLNDINQFKPDSYEYGAEERMNSLLYQFWVNDADTLRSKVGDNFIRLGLALER